ncbi:hypothetical protein DXV75_04215 [Alteromonas aestuariivivens]|uniref:Tyrosine specific protein phosphatases domain-containing protein n=2 Tax=Alteromonas aestuariivivens TaxID=1938339 RepID=A0A3D8MCI7_9ALTE|nr:hypothetical protein DXV75_04215 [Alteromonas aestuariivivens]
MNWISLGGGRICLGPPPFDVDVSWFSQNGISHIATVLGEHEQASEIRQLAAQANAEWLWVSYAHTGSASEGELMHLQQYVVELRQSLAEGAAIYLHCDNTRLRSQLLFYALCHYCGVPSASAYCLLHSIAARPANSVPRKELAWAAALGQSI